MDSDDHWVSPKIFQDFLKIFLQDFKYFLQSFCLGMELDVHLSLQLTVGET